MVKNDALLKMDIAKASLQAQLDNFVSAANSFHKTLNDVDKAGQCSLNLIHLEQDRKYILDRINDFLDFAEKLDAVPR